MIIKPDTYEVIEFKEGLLRILGENEEKVHGMKSRLEYGRNLRSYIREYVYLANLEDLRKIEGHKILLQYKDINEFTMVRRTLGLGLQVTRINCLQEVVSHTATLSREEYETMAQHF